MHEKDTNLIIMKAANDNLVPITLAQAVAWQESKWNTQALSFDQGHGKGLFQIDDRFHPFAETPDVWDAAKNANYGCALLHSLHQEYGNWPEAIMHYNGSGDESRLYAFHVWYYSQTQPWIPFLK
jgi:soluble lytic murein transglycosylase-like protein